MSHNDEVCTSDPDELEIFLATKPGYWQAKPLLLSYPQITDNTSIRLTQELIPSSQLSDDSPRPRKRMKVSSMEITLQGVGEVDSVLVSQDAVNF
jgi:O-succinylbenzoate synthase